MSIGPDAKIEEAKFEASKAVYTAKKTLSEFFQSPARYIWYISLAATMVGLFLGKSFSFSYWVLFLSVGLFNGVIYFNEEKYKEITE